MHAFAAAVHKRICDSEWSSCNIRILSRWTGLRMLELEDHLQNLDSGGALDLTFTHESTASQGSERQIQSSTGTQNTGLRVIEFTVVEQGGTG